MRKLQTKRLNITEDEPEEEEEPMINVEELMQRAKEAEKVTELMPQSAAEGEAPSKSEKPRMKKRTKQKV